MVPAALGGLKRLKALQLDNNRVFAIPSDLLFGCGALQTLSLHGCPIRPDELQVGGWLCAGGGGLCVPAQ